MSNEVNEIAGRIRELREVCGYTQQMLAEELGVSEEVYAEYERSGDIPISVIYEIAKKFKVDFHEILTGSPSRLDTYHIVRRGDGKPIDRYPGYRFEDLAFRFANKIMQPLLITLEPSDKPAAPVTHSGQEFNMVLEGTICLTLGKKEFMLYPGDSVYFNPTISHGQKCVGNVKARFITVITELG